MSAVSRGPRYVVRGSVLPKHRWETDRPRDRRTTRQRRDTDGDRVFVWHELAEIAYLWRVPHALDGTALEQAVGPLRTTPLDDALRHALVALDLGRSGRGMTRLTGFCAQSPQESLL